MTFEEELELAKSLGKNIKDFFMTLNEFSQQYMLYHFRQFTWQYMWTSGKFEKWGDIDYEWTQVRHKHEAEIQWYWEDAKEMPADVRPETLLIYMQTNPYIAIAYERLQEWVNNEGYKARL